MKFYIDIKKEDGQSSIVLEKVTSEASYCKFWNRMVSVNSIEITKELYSPNEVKVQLQITGSQDFEMDSFRTDLLGAQLWVYSVSGDSTNENRRTYIIRHYLIHQIKPVIGKATCVDFTAYSPDIQLTYDKFCATWVGKLFAKNLVPDVLTSTFSNTLLDLCWDSSHLQHLVYEDKKKELIQPYLVQYNESFYSFLRRTAYRCGEFLYWENEKLHLGLNDRADAAKVIQYAQLEGDFMFQSSRSVSAVHRDIFEKKDSTTSKGLGYYTSVTSTNYYDQLVKYNKTMHDVWNYKTKITGYISNTLKKPSINDMLIYLGSAIAKDTIKAKYKNEKEEKKYNDKWKFDAQNANESRKKPGQYSTNSNNQLVYNLYSTIPSAAIPKLNAQFYQNIQKGIQQATNTRMTVILNTSTYQHVGLGEIVQLNQNKYIVTRVYYKTDVKKEDSYKIQVITFNAKELYPPQPDTNKAIPLTCQAGAQTAFVEDNSDPLGLGRVRIKFPWQQESESASPWIRMSSQMASTNSGFNFLPNKGDEVLINFVDGNVEAPYVAGSLYSTSHKPSDSSAITSLNGHSIKFSDPKAGIGWMALQEFLPIMNFVQKKMDDKDEKKKDIQSKQAEVDKAKAALKPIGEVTDQADVSANSTNGMVNALFLKEKLKWARKFYMEVQAKPSAVKDVVPAAILKSAQIKMQLNADRAQVEDNFVTKLNAQKGTKLVDKLNSYIATLEQQKSGNSSNGEELTKLQKELDAVNKFKEKALKQTVTWADLGIENPDDYVKNAQYEMYIQQKAALFLAPDKKTQLDAYTWHNYGKADWNDSKKVSFATDAPAVKNLEGYSTLTLPNIQNLFMWYSNSKLDSASDERWFFPDLTGYKGSNRLDRLAHKIATLDSKLKNVEMPTKPSDTKDAKYKTYLEKEQELKKLKDKKDFNEWETDGKHAGGITITDTLGFYKIAMDAGKRNISISSPVGDVKIDAFSGISIEAPTGDVSIKGKNITLEAGNNVKIISGKNKNGKFSVKDSLKTIGKKAVTDVAVGALSAFIEAKTDLDGKMVDLKTLRVVYECLISPVEGTLQIHSGNNLILESNNAKANLPVGNINLRANKNQLKGSRIKALSAAVEMGLECYSVMRDYQKPLKNMTAKLDVLLQKNTGTIDGTTTLVTVAGLFGKKFCEKNDYVTVNSQTFIAELYNKLVTEDNKGITKCAEFTKKDLLDDDKLLDKQKKYYRDALLDEINKIRNIINTYYDNVSKLKASIDEVVTFTHVSDLSEPMKALFNLTDNGKFIKIDGINIEPAVEINDDDKLNDTDRHNLLKTFALATVSNDNSKGPAWLKEFRSKAVAEYFDPENPTQTIGDALKAATDKDKWAKVIECLNAPHPNEWAELLKKTVLNIADKELGYSGLVKDAQGILDDYAGLSAEKTGKLLFALDSDSTMEMEKSSGQITALPSSASLKSLKNKLKGSWG